MFCLMCVTEDKQLPNVAGVGVWMNIHYQITQHQPLDH